MLSLLTNPNTGSLYNYRIVSTTLQSDFYIKELEYLFIGKSLKKNSLKYTNPLDYSNYGIIYKGRSIIGEYTENIRFIKTKNSYRLSIGDFLEFDIINIKLC